MNLANKLDTLAKVYGCNGDVEHMLHEMCHVVVLGWTEFNLSTLELDIGREYRRMLHITSDWSEIKTIACQVCVFDRYPSLKKYELSVAEIAKNAPFKAVPDRQIVAHVNRLRNTKAAKERAKQVVKLIHRVWQEQREPQELQEEIDELH